MAAINLKVRSGNRIVVQFDGKQIGLVQSVNVSDDYGMEPASGIGDIKVAEYVPSMARHTIQVSSMLLNQGSMREAGIAVENGADALTGRVFDLIVYNKDDGSIMRKYMGCSYASGSVNVQKHAITVTDASLNALDVVGYGA
jgi:hypothetical protein